MRMKLGHQFRSRTDSGDADAHHPSGAALVFMAWNHPSEPCLMYVCDNSDSYNPSSANYCVFCRHHQKHIREWTWPWHD